MNKLLTVTLAVALHVHSLGVAQEKATDPFASATTVKSPIEDHFAIVPDENGHAYFPKGDESYYTYYLRKLSEPSLMHDHERLTGFRFRFTWLRSFDDPIVIRVWQEGAVAYIRAVRITQHKDYTLGAVNHDKTRRLTDDEFDALRKQIDVPLMLRPLSDIEKTVQSGGADGARWIFEIGVDRKYSMIDYWSPKDYGLKQYREMQYDVSKVRDPAIFARLGLWLLDFTKLRPNEDRLY